jgi:hypothetical protein
LTDFRRRDEAVVLTPRSHRSGPAVLSGAVGVSLDDRTKLLTRGTPSSEHASYSRLGALCCKARLQRASGRTEDLRGRVRLSAPDYSRK